MDSSNKRILLVDDDDLFLGALANTLKTEGFDVTAAQHGKIAEDLFGVYPYDLVISDINMPGLSGLDLLKYVHHTRPGTPVILMTGFAELKETAEGHDLGAKAFLPKPFKKEELLSSLRDILFPPEDPLALSEDENLDLYYCKISIDDFVSGREIKYDIYIRLSEKKYIKIAHQGEDISLERISAYKSKNIRFLYMLKEDFRRYMDFNLHLMPLVTSKKSISKDKKRSFLKHTSDVIMEHLFLNGVDEEGFQNAKTVVDSSVSLLTEPDEMMNLLNLLNAHSDHLYTHSLGVSMYSVMIARKVGWHSPANIFKVSLGGLLHDIGKKEIDRAILDKKRVDMTVDEVKEYESHPQRGAEILRAVATVPSDVVQIVLQHHEDCLGLGYPMHLKRSHIHPMSRLVSVANEFCGLVLKNPNAPVLPPQEAIRRMISMYSQKLDATFFVALMQLFKISPPDELLNRKT